MYDLPPPLSGTEIGPGTNLLVSGPPLTGKRRMALDILAWGTERGEGAIIVTTKDSAEKILRDFGKRTSNGESGPITVVDCVTKQQGLGNVQDDDRVKYVSSPIDMTGIGIKLSELLREFYVERGIERNRILLYSLSTLLMYSNLQTVFRFLHVFTGRVQSADALGVFVIDSTAHDERTMNTLKQLFDGVIEMDTDGTEQSVRLVGLVE